MLLHVEDKLVCSIYNKYNMQIEDYCLLVKVNTLNKCWHALYLAQRQTP